MRSASTEGWNGRTPSVTRQRLDGQVLELVGDDVARLGEAFQRAASSIGAVRPGGGDFGRGAGRLGRVDMAAIAEAGGGDREHAAELAAADDADRRAGRDDHSGASSTASGLRGAPCREALGQRGIGGQR